MAANIGRRKFLKASLALGGTALAAQSFEERALGAALKTGDPRAAQADPLTLPKGRIKHLEISRIICGGNLIGGLSLIHI
ncbi:MAG: hypothetical protein N3B01_05635, partial [Verrucomicrobiae bacterium]|nr:hypothetical protein [Verrucomicrobiae bacterium]